jgi:hypothetical protein
MAEEVSVVIVKEIGTNQNPIYFCSKSLEGPDSRYQKIEKRALALMVAARKLRRYFLVHSIVVRTNQPLKHVLFPPNLRFLGKYTSFGKIVKLCQNMEL